MLSSIINKHQLQILVKGVVISIVEAASRGAISILLIGFASFFSTDQYVTLLPWVACHQLIVVLAPFGTIDILSKLIRLISKNGNIALYNYIPSYILLNLLWAAPLAWLLTWATTKQSIAPISSLDTALTLITSGWLASQRATQQVMLLTQGAARFTVLRTVQGLTHLAASSLLVFLRISCLRSFFGGLLTALIVISIIDKSTTNRSFLWSPIAIREIFSQSWVFGMGAIFGWFSGLGSVILLTSITSPIEVARYGQIIPIVSLMGLLIGSIGSAIQASLISRQVEWTAKLQQQMGKFHDASFIVVGGFASVAIYIHLEQVGIVRFLAPQLPSYVWAYLFVAYVGYNLYLRGMLQYQYDIAATLSLRRLMISELTALTVFTFCIYHFPERPLWAGGGMLFARGAVVFSFSDKLSKVAKFERIRSLVIGGCSSLGLYFLWVFCSQ